MTVAAESVELDARMSRVRSLTNYDPHNLTLEQVRLIKDTVARGATDDELRLFVAVCGQTGLNPFTRQIHFVKRWDSVLGREVGTFQTGIDGYRLIAQRTGAYVGQTEVKWCGDDAQWVDVWLKDEPPAAARVGVLRRGWEKPIWAVARWKAYHQTRKDGQPNAMWLRYDAEQLAKCAEALALRKAFPQELSGIYTDEELQADRASITLSDISTAPALPTVSVEPALVNTAGPSVPVTFTSPALGPGVAVANVRLDNPPDHAPPLPPAAPVAPPPPSHRRKAVQHHPASRAEWDRFKDLLVQAAKAGLGSDLVKEAPAGSGRWYLSGEQLAVGLGVESGGKLWDNGEIVDPVLVGRVSAWIQTRLTP